MLHRDKQSTLASRKGNMALVCCPLTSFVLRNAGRAVASRNSRLYSTYRSSPVEGDASLYTKFVASKSPEEWKWVEALLKPTTVPQPKPKQEYHSGWFPPAVEKTADLPYFVPRNKNHMLPVYLEIKCNGQRRRTVVRNIEGDIWALEKDLMEFVRSQTGDQNLPSQVHEVLRKIRIRSDVYMLVERWLYQKGF